MLKPEKVVRFYAYTTKPHVDSMAKTLMEFDDVHVEPPEGLPGVKPPEGIETPELEAYENIVRALERASSLTGIPIEEILAEAQSERASLSEDYKKVISELDDLVGKYLSIKKEIELAKKAKSLLKERIRRFEELESKLSDLEMKIREYYAAALEVTEENPAKLRLGRVLLEVDRGLLRVSSLVNASLDTSMSIDDVNEIIKNALELLNEIKAKIHGIEEDIPDREKLEGIKLGMDDLIEALEGVRKDIYEYMTKRDKLSELKAVESMWSKMRDSMKKVPELTPLLAEREPAIAKITQQIAQLEDNVKESEISIREALVSAKKIATKVRESFIELRDALLSMREVSAGEAEQRVSELIENAKPLIAERGKLSEEIEKLKSLSEKEEVLRLKDELKKSLANIKGKMHVLASLALELKPKALVQKLRTMTYVGEEIAVISGWVPQKRRNELDKSLRDNLGRYVAVEFEEVKEDKAPSKIKMPNIMKPITLLTHKLYGMPSIYELDPTILTAIFFPLMFGMMFGDMGHGLSTLLLGVYLYKKFRGSMKDLGGLLIYSGIASMFFGYLYGMFFFVEVLKPIISPLHDTMQLIVVSLLFGALEMEVGFIVNTINKFIEGDLFAAIFEYKGLATVIMYLGAVLAVTWDRAQLNLIAKDPLFLSMGIFLLITMVSPIYRSVREGHGIGEGMSELIAVALEGTLALLSNSLSYVRLAAFAVIHEVFGVLAAQLIAGQEIFSLSNINLLLSPVALGSFIFVNIAVMGLEGLLSFIQATRLTFYEFFTKFYRASGRQFKRVSELLGPILS